MKLSDHRGGVRICLKCGSGGHSNATCSGPVTSFGLVIYANPGSGIQSGRLYPRSFTGCNIHGPGLGLELVERVDAMGIKQKESEVSEVSEVLFLLVERKDTVGFLNIVQGAYSDTSPYRERKLKRYVYELTCGERHKLVSSPFSDLWKIAGSTKRDMKKAERRFDSLNISDLLEKNPCSFEEADFLMPKGRLRRGETVQECAIRESAEETGYNPSDFELIESCPSYEEHFIGTDGKNYRNVFFVAKLKADAKVMTPLGTDPQQSKEVRNVGWFNLYQCRKLIRGYHQRKIDILSDVSLRLQNQSSRSHKAGTICGGQIERDL